MNSMILLWVCVPCAAVLTFLSVVMVLNEKGINPLDEILGRYRKQSLVGLILLPVFVFGMIGYGSNKTSTNAVPDSGTTPTNAPMMMVRGVSRATRPVTYLPWREGTDETWSFDPVPEARIVESWRLRGAAEDWTVCATTNLGPVVMTTDGRLVMTNGVFTAYDGLLAVVPEANWSLLGTNAPSCVWWAETPWASTIFTWQNVLLGRDTNVPVSVQAEFTHDGDYIFRYDLAAAGTNLTSLLYYRMRPEDYESEDRDEDGLLTYDEVTLYHSDPGLADSDGDGLLDCEEVWWYGTDPSVRSVPNGEIVARITGSATNDLYKWACRPDLDCPLTTMKLWDGFAADWPAGMTNLVYERTLSLGTANGYQRYFLSSKEAEAGDWDLRGLVLEWDDGRGNRGTASASPYGDSFLLPVTNSTVTIRLRAFAPKIRCPKPMYLIGYAPAVAVSGETPIYDENGVERAFCVTAGGSVSVAINRSHRPCRATPAPDELALPGLEDLADASGGAMVYVGNENGGRITVTRPGYYQLPAFVVDDPVTPTPRPRLMAPRGTPSDDERCKWIVCLDPSVSYSGEHLFVTTKLWYDPTNGDYCVDYVYPLDSKCLWRSWQISEEGYWLCSCEPEVTAGGDADGLPFVEKSCVLSSDRSVATGVIRVFGQEVWRGTAVHRWYDVGSGGGTKCGVKLLSEVDECGDCFGGCEDGNCDTASGTELNSVKFRLSLGMPRRGQHSGFVYFESEEPVAVTPELFRVTSREEAWVDDTTSGTERTVTCGDMNGRRVVLTPMTDGVRLTVTLAQSGELEDVWEVFNEGGDTNVVRITQKSRLNNVMSDETYVHDGGIWSKTDNITGVTETLERSDRLNDPADGKLYETRTTRDADGSLLGRVYTESSRIGEFGGAVLRETYYEEDTGSQVKWREATYWNDAVNRSRHGQLKLMTGNCVAWEYHDYDARGFETLRVEQRNGSSVPTDFPEAVAGELYWTSGLADAFVTVFDYTPLTGDDNDPADAEKVRCETRYVVRNGSVTRIARTWTRYTHVLTDEWYDAVKAETWRASSATASWTNPANAYSYAITYGEGLGYAPLVLRGEIAEELDENGVLTEVEAGDYGDVVWTITWKSNAQTYELVERDSCFGNEVRHATYLNDSDTLIDEEIRIYDDKNRLRSTTYLDGTSETNAWSCCRKLWSRDREGRTVLRSAVTGQDRLYYADEEVWLGELSTNGAHKVTQHFFDGLGREVETVVFAGTTPGAYTVPDAARGAGDAATETTDYPLGGNDSVVAVDGRGKMTVDERREFENRTENTKSVYAHSWSSMAKLQTLATQVRNGPRVTEKRWDSKWTRETEIEDYTAAGCAVRYEVTESSDCGTVTNRIVTCDFLGRTVSEVTPLGTTATTYHGATERTDATTYAAGAVTRVSTAIYNGRNEEIGSVQDGITNRTDEVYEMDLDGSWWKVMRSETSNGERIEATSERREQLTGHEDGVLSRMIEIDADGVVTETVEKFGTEVSERVTVVSNAVSGTTVQTRRFGVVQTIETPDETRMLSTDALGRQVAETRCADGVTVLPCVETVFTAVGDVVARRTHTNGTDSVTEAFEYDTFGRQVTSVDVLGNATETSYDAVGNVVERRGATWPVRYAYDTTGRRISLSTTKDGRIWNVTRWTYDPATGKCTAKRYPDGFQAAYAYTADGLPSVTTQPSGRTKTCVYDGKRQLVATASSDGAGDATFGYDDFGKMMAASNGVAWYAYLRHRGGTVTNETVQVGDSVHRLVRTVDGFGRLAGRGVHGQGSQTITYDDQGRVAAVSSGAAVATYAHGDDGSDAGYVLSVNGGATVERRVVRDAYRPEQIVAVSNFVNGVAVGGEAYTRDAKGRIVERVEMVENGERVESVGYDAVGQVVEFANCQLPSTNYQLVSYSYDRIGNIDGSRGLTYTADGGVTGFGGMTFGYDSASRLTTVASNGVTIAMYGYDAFDRRVRKTTVEATTTYFYDGWNLVREEIAGTNGTTDVIEYYWGKDISGSLDTAGGIGGLLYLKRNGAVYIPLYDASGNVTAYVNASGNIVISFGYDAFGNTTVRLGTSPSPYIPSFRYSTKYFDAETGLIYYGYRYYAPPTARWLTRDPLEEQGGLNLHCFCENDGVNKVDWLGQVPEPTADGDGRRFWRLMAKRLREEKQYNRAADMLEWSLNAHQRWFASSSDMSKDIKGSLEYDLVVKALIASYAPGWKGTVSQNKKVLDYNGGDLLSAVNKTLVDGADIGFSGNGCKSKDGLTYDFKLRVKVDSVYKYGDWRYDDLTLTEEDLGNMEKHNSLVKDFSWSAEFRDRRK